MPWRYMGAAAALTAMALVACTDVSVTALDVAEIEVKPEQGVLLPDETLLLEAELRDGSGRVLTDRPVNWSSDDASVATVRSSGEVRGRGPGVTRIRASAGGTEGTATITVVEPARIVLSETRVGFSAQPGASPPASQQVGIENGGDGTLTGLSYEISYASGASGWLQASLDGSTAPTSLTLGVSTSGLSAGTYRADVRIRSPFASNSPETVRVDLEVAEGSARIRLSPSAVSFSAQAGGSPPPDHTVRVTNSGAGELDDLEVSVSYQGGSPGWASASLERRRAPTDLVIGANPAGLGAGTYEARVTVRSAAAENSPQHVSVRLVVAGSPPRIGVEPGSVTFEVTDGGDLPSARAVEVTNTGSGTLDGLSATVAFGSGASGWLRADLGSSAAPTELTLRVTRTDLGPGSYNAVVRVASGAAANSPRTVAVRLNVAERTQDVSPGHSTVRASPERIPADGTSTSTITVRLRDGAGNAVTSAGHDVRLSLSGPGSLGAVRDRGGGRYTAELTAPGSPGEATVRARVDGNELSERATVEYTQVPQDDGGDDSDDDGGDGSDDGGDESDDGNDDSSDGDDDSDDSNDSDEAGAVSLGISYSTSGGPDSDRHLRVTVQVRRADGSAVRDATVGVRIRNRSGGSWVRSGRTNAHGEVTFNVNNHPSGCYETTVTSFSAGGLTWDGSTPGNEYCKP